MSCSNNCNITCNSQCNKKLKQLVHDLNNKITVLSGNMARLASKEQSKFTDASFLAIERISEISRMISNTLQSNGIEEVRVDAEADFINSYLNTLSRTYDIEITHDLETTRNKVTLKVDFPMIQRVIENIVENAKNAGATTIHIKDRLIGKYVQTIFVDNGRGIPEDKVKYIGTGYSTTEGYGHGNGTSFAKSVIEKHGGSLDWGNNLGGKGAMVVMQLPIVGSDMEVEVA